jgi:hypothetical protein
VGVPVEIGDPSGGGKHVGTRGEKICFEVEIRSSGKN